MRRKTKAKSFDFCYGMGVNWVDLNTGYIYMIQEYREKIEAGEKPAGIRVYDGENHISTIGEMKLRELMEDPEPDPRYLPETPEEHRRNF